MTSTLKINESFRPTLYDKMLPSGLGSDARSFFKRWDMDFVAKPTLAVNGLKAAVWIPKRFNAQGEAPLILALSEDNKMLFDPYTVDWFGGVATGGEVQVSSSDTVDDPSMSIEYFAKSVFVAIDLANNLVAPPEITYEPMYSKR
jgi:hypothetical protein